MKRSFTAVAILVYAGLTVGHVYRAITSAKFIFAGVLLPSWVSWPAAGLAALLTCILWWELKQIQCSEAPETP